MFSFILRDTGKLLRAALTLNPGIPNVLLGFDYSTLTAKDFIYERSDESGTLLTRFVKYLAIENSKFDKPIPKTIKYPDYFPITDKNSFRLELKKCTPVQIPHLIIFAYSYKTNSDPQKFVDVINDIDRFCIEHIDKMDYDTILRTLYSLMYLMPHKITRTTFYHKAVERLVNGFDSEFPKEKFVKACFYLGLGKKNANTASLLKTLLKEHLIRYLSELTPVDASIVGNASYKASIPVNNSEFIEKIVSEFDAYDQIEDDAMLVNAVKILRFHKVRSARICAKLNKVCTEKALAGFQLTGIAHVFAYFAECGWNEENTCSKFIKHMMLRIRETDDELRPKDLSTFLWCCAQLQLSYLLEKSELKYLDSLAIEMCDSNMFKHFNDQLIDCALSLWMLDYHSRGLVAEITSLRKNSSLMNPEREKLDTRYRVLMSCIAIEKPDWLMRDRKQVFVQTMPAPEFLVRNRPALLHAFDKLKTEGVDVKLVAPIEGINVPGIWAEVTQNLKSYLEVVEDSQMLRFNEVPNAIIQLKMRLIKHLGYNVVAIHADEVKMAKSLREFISSSNVEAKKDVAV